MQGDGPVLVKNVARWPKGVRKVAKEPSVQKIGARWRGGGEEVAKVISRELRNQQCSLRGEVRKTHESRQRNHLEWHAVCVRLKGDWKSSERRHFSRVASVLVSRPILKGDSKENRNYVQRDVDNGKNLGR